MHNTDLVLELQIWNIYLEGQLKLQYTASEANLFCDVYSS